MANKILDVKKENTIDYTSELFKQIDFDSLPNEFLNNGVENRGYKLDIDEVEQSDITLNFNKQKSKIIGAVIYLANPVLQFNHFTNKAHQLHEESGFYLSPEYGEKLKVKDGDIVRIATKNGSMKVKAIIDNKIGGEIGILPTFDKNLNSKKLFGSYRFTEAKISKV